MTMKEVILQQPGGTETTLSEMKEAASSLELTQSINEAHLALLFVVTMGGLLL